MLEDVGSLLKHMVGLTHAHVHTDCPSKAKEDTCSCEEGLLSFFFPFNHFFNRAQQSWGKVIFSKAYIKNFVHQGGGSSTQWGRLRGLARGVSRPTPRGKLRNLAGGGLQAHRVSQHALRQIVFIYLLQVLL